MKLFKYLLLVLMVVPSMLGALSRGKPTPAQHAEILKKKIMRLQTEVEALYEKKIALLQERSQLDVGKWEEEEE